MSKVVERFLKYVSFDTQSDPKSKTVPTTAKQLELAKYIEKELKEIGMSNVSLDNNGYVMGEIPANCKGNIPTIGFIAHMDTSPEMSGKDIKPQIIRNYDGGDIVLNKENNIILSPSYYSDLLQYKGEDIITSDGTTLLGADDKAGIAEIVTAMEYLIANPKIKHGTIKVGFTPDEEVGSGADHFDVAKFAADFAYTMDGSHLGEFEYENFNAAAATVTVHGRNVHPGYAKNKMLNSLFVAEDFVSRMPLNERPETTEGYEGFYHLDEMHGATDETKIEYIIRDFCKESFEKRKVFIKEIGEQVNKKYGEGTVEIEINDEYYNMKEKVEPVKHVIDNAVKAMEEVGITPKVQPIRGGTDGARLSFMGLPTPNIFAGGVNFHSKYEFVPIVSLEKAVEVILKIVEIYTRA